MNSGATMSKRTLAGLILAVALGLSLTACQDTKARAENEQLKAHVLQLQKDAGEQGNRVDVLTKENAELKDEVERLKKRHPVKRTAKSKAHRRTSKRTASSQN
jgi:cell division protein FtsB